MKTLRLLCLTIPKPSVLVLPRLILFYVVAVKATGVTTAPTMSNATVTQENMLQNNSLPSNMENIADTTNNAENVNDNIDEKLEEDDDAEFYWEEDGYFCYPLDGEYDSDSDLEDNDICYPGEEHYWEEYNRLMDEDEKKAGVYPWVHFVQREDDPLQRLPTSISNQYVKFDDQPNFILPAEIPPGQVERILWRDTFHEVDDNEVFAVGLPPELLQEFRTYFDKNGILKVVEKLLYDKNNTSAPGEENHTKVNKAKEESTTWTLDDGKKWSVKRADHWPTDMVWFDPIDEECYESVRSILRRGNFDVAAEGIRKQLNLTNPEDLVVHGLGAIFVSHFDHDPEYGILHRDIPNTRGAFYNILIPIYLPERDHASLYIGGMDGICAPINLQYNVATVIGSDSWHGTGECDFRDTGEFRLSMSIWVSEMTEANIKVISDDGLSPWPMPDDKDWYRAQTGRRITTESDRGRLPSYIVQDKQDDCEKVKDQCETDLYGVRAQCALTCGAYMEDYEYHSYLTKLKREEVGGTIYYSSTELTAFTAFVILLICTLIRAIRSKARRDDHHQRVHEWSKLQHPYTEYYEERLEMRL